MGACTSHEGQHTQTSPHSRGVGEAVQVVGSPSTTHADTKRLETLEQSLAALQQTVSQLQRENELLRTCKTGMHAVGGAGLRAASPNGGGGPMVSRRQSHADADHALGGWTDDNNICPPGMLPPTPPKRDSKSNTSAQETAAVVSSLARLEAQVADLMSRMGRAEGTLSGMSQMKEAWDARRAADEFAKQIRKLEEVGIPINSIRSSGPASGTTSAAMSFADDLPALDGLPQNRYPRQPVNRSGGGRRVPTDSSGGPSSGGGARTSAHKRIQSPSPNPLTPSLPPSQLPALPGARGNTGRASVSMLPAAGSHASNGGSGVLSRATAQPTMLPINECASDDRSSNTGSRRGVISNTPSHHGGLSSNPPAAALQASASGRTTWTSSGNLGNAGLPNGMGGPDKESTMMAGPGLNSTFKYGSVTPSDHAMVAQLRSGSGVRVAF